MPKFTPDLSKIEAGEPYELARKSLVEHVRQFAKHKGVSQDEIAQSTGLHRSNVNRVLSGRYSPELDTFLKIAESLGLKIKITP